MFNTAESIKYPYFYILQKSSKDLRHKVNSSIWPQVYFEITHSRQYQMREIILFDINPVMILDPHYTPLL
jgi:hypothetical protein